MNLPSLFQNKAKDKIPITNENPETNFKAFPSLYGKSKTEATRTPVRKDNNKYRNIFDLDKISYIF